MPLGLLLKLSKMQKMLKKSYRMQIVLFRLTKEMKCIIKILSLTKAGLKR